MFSQFQKFFQIWKNLNFFEFQGADPASLAIGTQVSAKYKGAYCEAKVKSVDKTIKVRVTLKGPHGANGPSITIKDKDIIRLDFFSILV